MVTRQQKRHSVDSVSTIGGKRLCLRVPLCMLHYGLTRQLNQMECPPFMQHIDPSVKKMQVSCILFYYLLHEKITEF
jgi:hypothetical protein